MSLLLTAALLASSAIAQELALPADDFSRTQQVYAYRKKRLEILPEVEFTPGSATYWSSSYRWGPRWRYHYGWGPVVVVHDPPLLESGWGIYQGGARVDVPTYLDLTGQLNERQALNERLEDMGRRARVGYALGGVGLAALVGGTIAHGFVDSREELQIASWTVAGGAVLGIGGLLGGSVSAGHAESLRYHPDETLELGEVRAQIEGYNQRLADELGMSEVDRALVDGDQVPVRPRRLR
jgi:hypothetical protein